MNYYSLLGLIVVMALVVMTPLLFWRLSRMQKSLDGILGVLNFIKLTKQAPEELKVEKVPTTFKK